MSILHFGCRVLQPEQARLTRESYTDIPNKALSSFFPNYFRRYGSSAVLREAINTVAEKYNITPDSFEETHRMEVNSYIRQYIADVMKAHTSRYIEYIKELLASEDKMTQCKKAYARAHGKRWTKVSEYDAVMSEAPFYVKEYLSGLQNGNHDDLQWIAEHEKDVPIEFFDNKIDSTLEPYRTDEVVQRLINNALQNYDLNMRYFASLKQEDFDAAICRFQTDYPDFSFIDDLRPYNDTAGAYVMILDQYKQLYMGITFSSLKKRIQTHWQKRHPLDRLIFGRIDNSILSINSFGALDTTRIMVAPVPSADADTTLPPIEESITKTKYLKKFLLNRVEGGLSDYYGIGTMPKSRYLR
ncbi:MAG: hypothetical protein IK107_06410 [Oscillospiraceae bacterium]|nr:hypothetical protein [Oscillospiraceae bacterium]